MKKTLLLLLTCVVLLTTTVQLPGRALEDGDDLLEGRHARSLAVMEGGIFALTEEEDGQTVWVIHPGQTPDSFLSLAPEDAITHLLAQEDTLYGFHIETGRAGRISVNGISWQETAVDTALYTRYPYMPGTPFLMEDSLYVPLMDITSAEDFAPLALAKSSLGTGETELLKGVSALAFIPYKPGQMLLLKVEEKQDGAAYWQLAALSMDSLKETPLPLTMPEAFPYSDGIGALAYDMQEDRIIYADSCQVMSSAGLKAFERVALLNFAHMSADYGAGFVVGGRYAVYTDSLSIRRVDQAIQIKDLTIRGFIPGEVVSRFQKARPDVLPLIQNNTLNPEDVFLRIQGRDDTVDVFILSINPGFRALINKGYALDLSKDTQLTADINSLYPALRTALMNDAGQLCAVPVRLHNANTAIHTDYWQSVFMDRPIAQTWGELMDARLAFADSDRDDLIFFAMGDSPQIIDYMLEDYILHYEQRNSFLDFDHPALRHALSTYLSAKNLRLDVEADDPASETGPTNHLVALFASGWQFGTRGEDNPIIDLPPFVFSAGETPLSKVHVFAAVVNPNSKNPQLAIDFLKALSEKEADPRRYYAIHPEANEPYAYPDEELEQLVALMEDQLKEFTAQIAAMEETQEASADLEFLRQRVAQLTLDLADRERVRWMLSAKEIEDYRSQAQHMTTTAHSLLLGEQAWQQIQSLTQRLYQGALSVDSFIQEMNQLSRLVYREAKQ